MATITNGHVIPAGILESSHMDENKPLHGNGYSLPCGA